MALDKLVDSAQLDSDLEDVADAIRAKSGGTDPLAFPSGFVSEIGNIPSGGGGGIVRTKPWRPPDMPDITSLPFPSDYAYASYMTVDTALGITEFQMTNHIATGAKLIRGHISNGSFVSDEEFSISNVTPTITIPPTQDRYIVYLAVAQDYWTYGASSVSSSLSDKILYIPAIEQYSYKASGNYGQGYILTPHTKFLTLTGYDTHATDMSQVLEVLDTTAVEVLVDSGAKVRFSNALKYISYGTHKTENDPTQNVAFMFQSAGSLTEFDGSGLKVKDSSIQGLFRYDYALRTVNLSGWDLTNTTNVDNSFDNMTNLQNFVLENTVLPNANLSFVNTAYLTDTSLVNIANALNPTAHTLRLHATPKARLSAITGTVSSGKFTAGDGATTLLDFITNTKGWTVA